EDDDVVGLTDVLVQWLLDTDVDLDVLDVVDDVGDNVEVDDGLLLLTVLVLVLVEVGVVDVTLVVEDVVDGVELADVDVLVAALVAVVVIVVVKDVVVLLYDVELHGVDDAVAASVRALSPIEHDAP